MAKQKEEWAGWIILTTILAILWWLLTRGKEALFQEQVTVKISPAQEADPDTPQFDSNEISAAARFGIIDALPPFGDLPYSCPAGWNRWYDKAKGNYVCRPQYLD